MNINLIIKYNHQFLCEKDKNKITFIKVPQYFPSNDAFSNTSIFITLLLSGLINDDYCSSVSGDFPFWDKLFEKWFFPECFKQIDSDVYMYDLDEFLADCDVKNQELESVLQKRPAKLVWRKKEEIKDVINEEDSLEENNISYNLNWENIDKKLIDTVNKLRTRNQNDVLLLYSGGKDSTLAAIRLRNMGYNPYFIHFNNGSMRDTDKPYLTFQKIFNPLDGYYFPYDFSEVDIEDLFKKYYGAWLDGEQKKGLHLTSEIRCLSCRMAMYTKALEIARNNNFKIIAEGARVQQKFFIEQEYFVKILEQLADSYGLKILFPVLYLDDDKKLVTELIDNGLSSKTWESKCLLGEAAVEKTKKDEAVIMDYYDKQIHPKILSYLKRKK